VDITIHTLAYCNTDSAKLSFPSSFNQICSSEFGLLYSESKKTTSGSCLQNGYLFVG